MRLSVLEELNGYDLIRTKEKMNTNVSILKKLHGLSHERRAGCGDYYTLRPAEVRVRMDDRHRELK